MKKKNHLEEEPHIAMQFKIGNCKVTFATNYCEDKTQEDVEEISKRIASNAYSHLVAIEMARKKAVEQISW